MSVRHLSAAFRKKIKSRNVKISISVFVQNNISFLSVKKSAQLEVGLGLRLVSVGVAVNHFYLRFLFCHSDPVWSNLLCLEVDQQRSDIQFSI